MYTPGQGKAVDVDGHLLNRCVHPWAGTGSRCGGTPLDKGVYTPGQAQAADVEGHLLNRCVYTPGQGQAADVDGHLLTKCVHPWTGTGSRCGRTTR